jgi:V/A-type H+-transporting ATPase subunit E
MQAKDIHDVQLKELIDTIHRDAVTKGQEESEMLLKQARAKAEMLLSEAQAQADTVLATARREQERLEHSGRESLKQASRDLLLKVRKQLEALFLDLLKEKTTAALNATAFTEAVATMVSNWNPDLQGNIELLLPPQKLSDLTQVLQKSLKEKISSGIEIKTAPNLSTGFQIYEKNGHAYYDFSAESIAESLAVYLNPVMAKIIQESLLRDV